VAAQRIVDIVKGYLAVLPDYGIHSKKAVVFGSCARGEATEWSDIDLVVIAPEFDEVWDVSLKKNLWHARRRADERIEPIPCGLKEWDAGDTERPIIEIAREEGEIIDLAAL